MNRTVPFIKQNPKENTCGAICLSMVLAAHNINICYRDIWEKISECNPLQPTAKYCANRKMLEYLESLGLRATLVSAKSALGMLAFCQQRGIEVIANHALSKTRLSGHFTVFVCSDNMGLHFNDPMRDKGGTRMKEKDFKELSGITIPCNINRANTLMLISFEPIESGEFSDGKDSVQTFAEIIPMVNSVYNHEIDRWIDKR